ncbi:MAG: hypothetical protein ACJAZ3_001692 [Sphingobacteriales bacterium]|jgi:hypothetical protein
MIKKLKILTILLVCINALYAQSNATYGTDFWLGFTQNGFFGGQDSKLTLTINARVLSFVTVSTELGDTTLLANPALPLELELENSFQASTGKSTKGIHVTATDSVSVVATNSSFRTNDNSLILPIELLGNEYYIGTHNESSATAQILIVATEDNTAVELSGPNFTTKNIILSKGQCYLYDQSIDLTGFYVIGKDPCKKIAVFAGNECTYVNGPFCDHLYEQMVPTNGLGTKYFTVPLLSRKKGDLFKFLATTDNTVVKIDGKNRFYLDKGDHGATQLERPSVIEANYPIAVWQLSNSGTYDGNENTDPFLLQLTPADLGIERTSFNTVNGQSEERVVHYVNVVSKTSDVAGVVLDTNLVIDDFKPYEYDNSYSYAQLTLPDSLLNTIVSHQIASGTGIFNAYVYGYAYHYSYGYNLGGTIIPIEYSIGINNEGVYCSNSPVQFSIDAPVALSKPKVVWNFGDGQFSSNLNPVHLFSKSGDYMVKCTAYFGSDSCLVVEDSVQVSIGGSTKVNITASASKTEACEGELLQLYATGSAAGYQWFPEEGITNPTSANTSVYPKETTTYYVVGVGNDCASSGVDSVHLDISPFAHASFTYTIEETNLNLQANVDNSSDFYTWNISTAFGAKSGSSLNYVFPYNLYFNVELVTGNKCGTDRVSKTFFINKNGGSEDGVGDKGTVSVYEPKAESEGVFIYPNPVKSNYLYLKLPTSNSYQIEIIDVQGRKIQSTKVFNTTTSQIEIDISTLSPGLYNLSAIYISEKLRESTQINSLFIRQ